MGEKEYSGLEEIMGARVNDIYHNNSDIEVQDNVENFYSQRVEGQSEHSKETVSEAGRVLNIAIFERDKVVQRQSEPENNGHSKQEVLQVEQARLERGLDILNQLINPSDSGQTIEELLKIVRVLHKGTKGEAIFGDVNDNERLLDYEDLERFLLRFENPKNIEAYRLENPKYVYWQETGEVKSD